MAKQSESSIGVVKSSGCIFLCCCYIAHIEDIKTCDEAWNESVKNGWIRAKDSYCNVSRYNLANNLNGIYNRGIKPGLTFKKEGNHWVLYKGQNKVYSP